MGGGRTTHRMADILGQAKGVGAPRRCLGAPCLELVTYNCMSLRQNGRLHEVSKRFRRSDIVALHGTRLGRKQGFDDEKVDAGGHFGISAPAGAGAYTKAHAGVMVLLKKGILKP